jgi:hypothetical protein
VANHFPVCSEAKVVTVQYGLALANNVPIVANGVLQLTGTPAPAMSWSFDWSYDSNGDLQVDYGTFDQDEVEASFTVLLNSMMTTMGIEESQWALLAKVQRYWTFYPSVVGSPLQVTAQDFMPYTPSA